MSLRKQLKFSNELESMSESVGKCRKVSESVGKSCRAEREPALEGGGRSKIGKLGIGEMPRKENGDRGRVVEEGHGIDWGAPLRVALPQGGRQERVGCAEAGRWAIKGAAVRALSARGDQVAEWFCPRTAES